METWRKELIDIVNETRHEFPSDFPKADEDKELVRTTILRKLSQRRDGKVFDYLKQKGKGDMFPEVPELLGLEETVLNAIKETVQKYLDQGYKDVDIALGHDEDDDLVVQVLPREEEKHDDVEKV